MIYDEMNKKERDPVDDIRTKSGNETLAETSREMPRKDAPTISVTRKMKRESRKMER